MSQTRRCDATDAALWCHRRRIKGDNNYNPQLLFQTWSERHQDQRHQDQLTSTSVTRTSVTRTSITRTSVTRTTVTRTNIIWISWSSLAAAGGSDARPSTRRLASSEERLQFVTSHITTALLSPLYCHQYPVVTTTLSPKPWCHHHFTTNLSSTTTLSLCCHCCHGIRNTSAVWVA